MRHYSKKKKKKSDRPNKSVSPRFRFSGAEETKIVKREPCGPSPLLSPWLTAERLRAETIPNTLARHISKLTLKWADIRLPPLSTGGPTN